MKVYKKESTLSLIILLLIITSCQRSKKNDHQFSTEVSSQSYVSKGNSWMSKKVSQHTDEIKYTAVSVPLEYHISNNYPGLGKDVVDSILKTVKNERLIEFRFESYRHKDLLMYEFTNRSYKESIEYLAFKTKKDFYVNTNSKKHIRCIGVHLERNFKIAPYKKLLLYFEGVPENESLQLVYNDNLYQNGFFKFNLEQKNIKL